MTTTPDAVRRDPGVESNARLTAATGMLLLVMLAAEGLTILRIRSLVSWHVAIGLALLPPVGVKLGSTLWRFSRYYLGHVRYVRAGPPPVILRLVGPFVYLTTIAVLLSGVALWLVGPGSGLASGLLFVHKATFVLWFGFMTIHVLGHVVEATRLTLADAGRGRRLAGARLRQGTVALSFVAGLVVAVATWGVATGWAHHLSGLPGH